MATWNDRLAGWLNKFLVEQVATRVAKWLPRSQSFISFGRDVHFSDGERFRFTMVSWRRTEDDRYEAYGYVPFRLVTGQIEKIPFTVYMDAGLVGTDMGEVLDPETDQPL